MNEVAMQVRDHVIVFTDKTVHEITKQQFDFLWKASATADHIRIDGMIVKFSSVSKIMTMSEYHRQYPENKPVEFRELKPITSSKDPNARRGMVEGLERYIQSDRYQGTDKPLKLLEQMKITL